MKLLVILKWIPEKNEYHLLMPNDRKNLIYNIYGCEKFDQIADMPDRNKEELYIMDFHRYKEENDGIQT